MRRAQHLVLQLALACTFAGLSTASRHPGLTAWRHGGKGGLEGCILMLGTPLAAPGSLRDAAATRLRLRWARAW